MSDKAWKAAERTVAKMLGGVRNPLSGSLSDRTKGDVLHPTLYVEVKQRKRFAIVPIMRDTEEKAKKEKKTPVLVLHQVRSKTRYYMVTEKTFLELIRNERNTANR